jgi:hypothetical protein
MRPKPNPRILQRLKDIYSSSSSESDPKSIVGISSSSSSSPSDTILGGGALLVLATAEEVLATAEEVLATAEEVLATAEEVLATAEEVACGTTVVGFQLANGAGVGVGAAGAGVVSAGWEAGGGLEAKKDAVEDCVGRAGSAAFVVATGGGTNESCISASWSAGLCSPCPSANSKPRVLRAEASSSDSSTRKRVRALVEGMGRTIGGRRGWRRRSREAWVCKNRNEVNAI